MHLMEGNEGKHGVPIASRKNELRSSSICRLKSRLEDQYS